MPFIGPAFFILGLVVACVTADGSTTMKTFSTALSDSTLMTGPPAVTPTISDSDTNRTDTNSTITPFTTEQTDNGTSTDSSQSTTPTMYTAKPTNPSATTTSTQTNTNQKDKSATAKPQKDSGDNIGIIILIVIILVAFVFGLACYFTRKRGRRYSVDFNSRPDDANIPLSTIEPEALADAAPHNGLKTFESVETATEEPKEPEAEPDMKEEQKAEPDKSVVDPGAESPAPPPSPESSEEDKPKEDAAGPSPPAPVDPTVDEKTDDEGAVSNKTSVESLKETNTNNSNNADCSQQGDLKSSSLLWDAPLDCPV